MAPTLSNIDTIMENQSQLQALFIQRMGEMENELKTVMSPTASTTTSTLAAQFFKFKEFMVTALRSLQSQITLLSHNLDSLETHRRRKILLLHGVPETKDEVTAAVVVNVVANHLQMTDFKVSDITRCHRMGNSSQKQPRPILFKMESLDSRNQIWYNKTKLRGTGITLSEFLTKPRHDIFMAARKKFGVTKCWTRDGSVFVIGSDGKRHRINCVEDFGCVEIPEAESNNRPVVQTAPTAPVASTASKVNITKTRRTVCKK